MPKKRRKKATVWAVPIKTIVETAGHLLVLAVEPEDAIRAAEKHCDQCSANTTFGESVSLIVDFEEDPEFLPRPKPGSAPDIIASEILSEESETP